MCAHTHRYMHMHMHMHMYMYIVGGIDGCCTEHSMNKFLKNLTYSFK